MLDKAIGIAARAHENKVNKNGEPIIFHSLRVMMSLEREQERICGVLHDVLEGPLFDLDGLRREGFGDDVLAVLDCLTKRREESYETWIGRMLENKTACIVRMAEIQDEKEQLGKSVNVKNDREYSMLKEIVMANKRLTSRAIQAIETKKRIISCGKKLIQSEGFDNASVNEISKNAGITVGTFYYYFNSKDELLYELVPKMTDYFKSEEAQLMKEKNSYLQLQSYFSYLIHFPFDKYKDVMKHILASETATAFIDGDRIPAIEAIIAEGQQKEEFKADFSAAYIAKLLFYSNRGVFEHWLSHPEEYDYPEAANETISRLAYTFLTQKGRSGVVDAYC